jgi:hypothetical protein
MARKDAYYFGQLATKVEIFAFPRVGSHYFAYCLSGLFDLVAIKNEHLDNPEAIARQDEINESVLYQLGLREEGVPYQPLIIDPLSTGMHGVPRLADKPVIILVRDPIATLYSFYRVSRARWGQTDGIWPWLMHAHAGYTAFYNRAFEIVAESPGRVQLVRFEELVESSDVLEQVVQFIGHRPKLRPEFVHQILRFDNFARRGPRTFYRAGHNRSWLEDATFCAAVEQLPGTDFGPWGYPSMAEYRAVLRG